MGLPYLQPNDAYASPINEIFQPAKAAIVSTLTDTVERGDKVAFNYSAPAGQVATTNWIGVHPRVNGTQPGSKSYVTWQYTPAASGTVQFDTTGLSAGAYEAILYYSNGYSQISAPVAFNVTAPAYTSTGDLRRPT